MNDFLMAAASATAAGAPGSGALEVLAGAGLDLTDETIADGITTGGTTTGETMQDEEGGE
ncbi:hypothetical protein SAMN05216188_10396 [Lentzea xinjiangensis]|uniref:Uncharacterized protein n=1 Tax=Lentzea xinjiangensis TaxID=402600 RepID=A0A1H9G6I6_9PSEU|nr:hypothetical protein [Lentzea xinjiangensis]SEQ45746.1 hypothetical protein SAMN05216188_10396 [Lentzea xinjiangensis]